MNKKVQPYKKHFNKEVTDFKKARTYEIIDELFQSVICNPSNFTMRKMSVLTDMPTSVFYYYFIDKHNLAVAFATNIMSEIINKDDMSSTDIKELFFAYFKKHLDLFSIIYIDHTLDFAFADIAGTLENSGYTYDDKFFKNEIAELIILAKE